jgi:DnaJ-class molecular chaperone
VNIRPGKVFVKVEEIPHPTFERKTHDLKLTVIITLKEALLGFIKEI